MSDLISRSIYKSKLLKALDVLNKEYRGAILNEDNELILAIQNQKSAYMIALRLLDNEPTSYDIDRIIMELERIRVKETCNKEKCDTKEICRICVVDDAIEIVKQGGKE